MDAKIFEKPSKSFYVGIHWIALAEHSQMSTHVPGSFFRFFAPFSVGQISQQQHKGLCSLFPMILKSQCVLKCFGVQLQSKKGNLILQDGSLKSTCELGYDGPLYDGLLSMTDNMLGPSPMHMKYVSYVYDRFCIWRTNFLGPVESIISRFTCTYIWNLHTVWSYTHGNILISIHIFANHKIRFSY